MEGLADAIALQAVARISGTISQPHRHGTELLRFDAMEQSAAEVLTDLLAAYVQEVGAAAVRLAEHCQRSECALVDVLQAIAAVGAAPHPLELQHMAMDNRLAFPAHVPQFPLPRKPRPTGSPRAGSPRGRGGLAVPAARGEAFGWRRDADGATNQQRSVPVFLPSLPPTFTFTGAPVFQNPYAPAAAAQAVPDADDAAAQEPGGGAAAEQALSALRPLVEPLLRRRNQSWAGAVPALMRGDKAVALDSALRGADADASSRALEELLATVAAGTAQPEASAAAGDGSLYSATVAKVAAAVAADGSGDSETTPEAAPELLGDRSQKRKAKDADEQRRRSKRRIAKPADLTLPTAGLAAGDGETIGRAAMMNAVQQPAPGPSQPVVGLPVQVEATTPPVVPIELPPEEGQGGAALAAAPAAGGANARAQRDKKEGPTKRVPVEAQPLTPLLSSQLETLLADLLVRGLPGVTVNGQATGIFDVDLAVAVVHYREIVAQPMDLGTMKKKLKRGQYATASEFEADFGKLIAACKQYNTRDPSHPGYSDGQYYLKLGAVLDKQFQKRWDKFLESAAEQEEAAAKGKEMFVRGSSSGAPGAGAGIKLALGGAQVKGAGGKNRRPAHLRNAVYWRGDEGVARAVRARVEAEEAEGKQLAGGRPPGWRPNRRDILLANRHRETQSAGAAGSGAAKGSGASTAARPGAAAAAEPGAASDAKSGAADGGGGPGNVELTRTGSLGSVL